MTRPMAPRMLECTSATVSYRSKITKLHFKTKRIKNKLMKSCFSWSRCKYSHVDSQNTSYNKFSVKCKGPRQAGLSISFKLYVQNHVKLKICVN